MTALLTALLAAFGFFGFGPSRGPVPAEPTVEVVASAAHARVADEAPDLPEARPEAARTPPSAQLPLALPPGVPAIERRVTFTQSEIELPSRPAPRLHLAALGARAPPLA